MPEEKFETNLLRLISSELYFLCGMFAANQMFGKSYFALGVHEKAAADQAVVSAVRSNYQALTPDPLKDTMATPLPVGFAAPEK